jgi:ketopantoate hydroxymethyltransferase
LDPEELKSFKGIRKITVLTAYDYKMARIQVLVVNDMLGLDEG